MEKLEDLTETQWKIADAIAMNLATQEKFDNNEFRKAIGYLRAYQSRENAGASFFSYLETLARHGGRIGHSKKTQSYHQNILDVCQQFLAEEYASQPVVMLYILGWASRLVRYYLGAPPLETKTIDDIPSEREAELEAIYERQNLAVGDIVAATVGAINKNKVTYVLLGGVKLSNKEPKNAALLSEGQQVKVEIVDLKDDGKVRKVKLRLDLLG